MKLQQAGKQYLAPKDNSPRLVADLLKRVSAGNVAVAAAIAKRERRQAKQL